MKISNEVCVECGATFLQNSVATSMGCPDCEPFIQAEELWLRTYGTQLELKGMGTMCYLIVNKEPCGAPARFAVLNDSGSPLAPDTMVSAFCREHLLTRLATLKEFKVEDVEDI